MSTYHIRRVLPLASQTIAIPAAGQTNPMFSGSMTVIRPNRQAPTYAVSQATVRTDSCTLERVCSRVLTSSVWSEKDPRGKRNRRLTRWSHEPTALHPTRSRRPVRTAGSSSNCSERCRRTTGERGVRRADHGAELPGSARGIAHRSRAALLREPQPFSGERAARRLDADAVRRVRGPVPAGSHRHRRITPDRPGDADPVRAAGGARGAGSADAADPAARIARGAPRGGQAGAAAADRQRLHRTPPAALRQRCGRRGDRRGAARPALRPGAGGARAR